jgi:hypothetical protein
MVRIPPDPLGIVEWAWSWLFFVSIGVLTTFLCVFAWRRGRLLAARWRVPDFRSLAMGLDDAAQDNAAGVKAAAAPATAWNQARNLWLAALLLSTINWFLVLAGCTLMWLLCGPSLPNPNR